MKKLLSIMLIVSIIIMVGYFVSAETFRQGDVRFSYNPSNIVTKTAAYTLTASDSMVKVTASTANIVITLPTVASTRAAGARSYKILKTDATGYAIVVTPASGDTIGGESTRYLIAQNDYVVISAGSGVNWAVGFESPLIKEDYEAGTVTFNQRLNVIDLSTTSTLSTSACGSFMTLGLISSSAVTTLPAATNGCELKFVTATTTGKYQASIITPSTADILYGALSSVSSTNSSSYLAAADTLTFTSSSQQVGDWVSFVSDGTNWYGQGMHVSPSSMTFTNFD